MNDRRQWVAIGLLALAGAGAFALNRYDGGTPPPPTPAAAAPAAATDTPAAAATVAADAPRSEKAAGEAPPAKPAPPNPFAVRDWAPPRPPVAAAPPVPPPPRAPPLPFRYLGRVSEAEAGPAFMLLAGEKVLSVRAGDVIDGLYRVEAYEHGQLHFLYQPMNLRQSLYVGHDS